MLHKIKGDYEINVQKKKFFEKIFFFKYVGIVERRLKLYQSEEIGT
jgi:hypothetical protein